MIRKSGRKTINYRHHKGKTYKPVIRKQSKKAIYKYLAKTGLSNTHSYRIYKHKLRGFVLYLDTDGPTKNKVV